MKKNIIDSKAVPQICAICSFGTQLPDGSGILCKKTGIRLPESTCKKFEYDPLKRVPRRAPEMPKFTQEDFSL
ncbi:MAG: hypothetical protein IJZ88_00810 [Clostridia bacterium]|nr:hypothetical protein [Clostridia bacterium]